MADDEIIERFRKIQQEERQAWDWTNRFVKNKNGGIKENVLNNVTLIFKNDPLFKGKFKFNEFTGDSEIIKQINIMGGKISSGIIEDVAEDYIVEYIQSNYKFTTRPDLIYRAFNIVAHLNPYNPVRDYFDEAESKWDHIKRVSTFLPDYLGANQNEVTTLITKLFFTGTVAKVYDPDTKFDFVLDLVGDQGTGKTTFLKKLARDWYVDSIENFKDKDEYTKMQRALIVNDDEMKATDISSFPALKKFITLTELEYRKPYERHTVRYKKHFTLARTSNEIDYLKDKTGNRRFLPIQVSRDKQKKHPVTDLNETDVMQFWGEIVHYYKENGIHYPTSEEEKSIAESREDFQYVDEIENQINIFLDNRIEEWVASSDIAEDGLHIDSLITNRKIAQKIKYVMDNKPDWRSGYKGKKRVWWKD